mmetsp:Transcript_108143/g.345373  ORF Transcript_108143/g.345373 Transcript_108143/m.345373 type:complete len:203 (-) Transcript_108143:291-899(-)
MAPGPRRHAGPGRQRLRRRHRKPGRRLRCRRVAAARPGLGGEGDGQHDAGHEARAEGAELAGADDREPGHGGGGDASFGGLQRGGHRHDPADAAGVRAPAEGDPRPLEGQTRGGGLVGRVLRGHRRALHGHARLRPLREPRIDGARLEGGVDGSGRREDRGVATGLRVLGPGDPGGARARGEPERRRGGGVGRGATSARSRA